jgi:hypothetical protein
VGDHCGELNEDELAVVTVLVPIHAGHDNDDGLSVRRNRRAGNFDDFLQVAQLDLSSLSARATWRSDGEERR